MFNSIFSQILGSLGGAAGGGGVQGANPFDSITSMIGGPGSKQGTLFSLPNELLTGVADLGTSENIIKDIAGLTKPIGNLASGAIGSLGGLNPFGSGGEGSGRLGGIIPYHYLPFLGLGALIAALEGNQEEEV